MDVTTIIHKQLLYRANACACGSTPAAGGKVYTSEIVQMTGLT